MKPYFRLRTQLSKMDSSILDLCSVTQKSYPYLSSRFTAKSGKFFTESDQWKILEYINEPIDKMGYYFSMNQRNGVEENWWN